MNRLEGKVALISGGARGIGAATARLMVEEGANVVVGDLLDSEGAALAEELGPRARYCHLDVTRPEDWDAAVAQAVGTFGKLDILVNNAGIANMGPIDVYSHDDWNQIVNVNLTGVFNGIKAVIPALKQAGHGSIVNVSSAAGFQGTPAMPGYVATKFGVRGLTKAAAADLCRFGIRVNSVHPGFIHTPMTAPTQLPVHIVPLQRVGEAEEIAKLILFVASDEASYSTGSEFKADGGTTGCVVQFDPIGLADA